MTPDLHDLTDDALRRHLAERLGWRNLRATDYWQEGYYSTDHITDALEGIPPDGDGMALVPDWPTDEGAALRACMDLARERDLTLRLSYALDGNTPVVWAWLHKAETFTEEYSAYAPTLTRALAELLATALEADR